jgi:uncharacterized protein
VLVIRKIRNKGRGVFTTTAIRKGAIVEVAPVILFGSDDFLSSPLPDYVFTWSAREKALTLGLGSLFNHSFDPNIGSRRKIRAQKVEFFALRSLAAGEELCLNYGYGEAYRSGPNMYLHEKPRSYVQRPLTGDWYDAEIEAWNKRVRFAAWTDRDRIEGSRKARAATTPRRTWTARELRRIPTLAPNLVIEAKIKVPTGSPLHRTSMEVSESVVDLLRLVDGRRSFADLMRTMLRRANVPKAEVAALNDTLTELFERLMAAQALNLKPRFG